MENEIRRLGTDYAASALRPRWDALDDADPALLDAILHEAAAAGIFGFTIPEAAGGSGLGAAEYAMFLEEVSRACGGIGALLAAHFAGLAPLLIAGGANGLAVLSKVTEAEQQGLPALCVVAIKENASPDLVPEDIETTVRLNAGVCVVNGLKTKVLGAGAAQYLTVLGKDPQSGALCWAVVPRNPSGVEIRPQAPRLGLRICPINDVAFSGTEIPVENVIARFTERERLLDCLRLVDPALAAVAIGLAAEARDAAFRYSLERYQGGKTICDHDAVRMMLADMDVSIRASRAFAYGPDAGFAGSAFAADAAETTCLDAVQVHGGYGYMVDFRIERMLRDAKTYRALLGSRARRMEWIRGEIDRRR